VAVFDFDCTVILEMQRVSGNHPLTDLIRKMRLVAILRLDDLTYAIPLVEALLRGGVRALEFTLTNPDAPKVVATLVQEFAEFSNGTAAVGIGSVRTVDEAKMSIDSGAQFLVSPITNCEIIDQANANRIPIFPGAFSPTEIAIAWEMGAEIVKVFPSRGLGPEYIRDVLAPMPYLQLMPTGGVSLANMSDYFDAGAVAVGVGGKFTSADAIRNQRWDEITRSALAFTNAAAIA